MKNLQTHMNDYLDFCASQKCLDEKTLKAYRIDLRQFSEQTAVADAAEITSDILEKYITILHQQYKPRTAKRKIASVKALFHYFEYKEIIDRNPFNKIQIRFREPVILPKTIPLHTVETFLAAIYRQRNYAKTDYQKRNALRDAAVVELLFSTGMRISELCTLKDEDVNLYDGIILIYGKGDKERRIQIGNAAVIRILEEYRDSFHKEILSLLDTSRSFLGVPLGFDGSQRISPVYPITSATSSVSALMVSSLPVPAFTVSLPL